MENTPELPVNPLSTPPAQNKPKKELRHFYLPGTNYFKQRRMRPLFFGWICGVMTMLALGCGVLLFWMLHYASDYPNEYGSFSPLYYGAAMLSVVVLILLLVFTALGLPVLYGHVGGVKQVFKIYIHELVFLAVILTVMLTLSIRVAGSRQPDPYPYFPDDCITCARPL